MNNPGGNSYQEWLSRAASSLNLAKKSGGADVNYEDLAYQSQQAAEKALKGFLVFLNIEPEKTHDFRKLLKAISNEEDIPDYIKAVIELNRYAFETRYPGLNNFVSKDEYICSVRTAEKCNEWVKNKISRRIRKILENKDIFDISLDKLRLDDRLFEKYELYQITKAFAEAVRKSMPEIKKLIQDETPDYDEKQSLLSEMDSNDFSVIEFTNNFIYKRPGLYRKIIEMQNNIIRNSNDFVQYRKLIRIRQEIKESNTQKKHPSGDRKSAMDDYSR